ncbi:MAG: hypothetical protein AAF270_10825 [Pseudomonadota bacterium]
MTAAEQTERQGERWVLSSRRDMREAASLICAEAERKVSIMTRDLEPGIYDHPDFVDAVKKLILSRRFARVRVLISDPSRAIKNGNRLVTMGRRLNSFIEFRNVHEDYRERPEAYCIADDKAIAYRLDAGRWDGIADSWTPPVARNYLQSFDEIWSASEVENEFRNLHL